MNDAPVSPADHRPDEAARFCPHCGDLATDPTRCPGWLAHRARIRFHAEQWENDEWTGLIGPNDSLGYVVAQREHKQRRFPHMLTRLVAAVTRYVPIAEPVSRDEELQQLLDGDNNNFTAFMGRAWGVERDRAIDAETLARGLRADLALVLPMDPGDDYDDREEFSVLGDWGVDGHSSREDAVRAARKALAEHPGCGARARLRIVRTWYAVDAQFIGPWEDIDLDGEPT